MFLKTFLLLRVKLLPRSWFQKLVLTRSSNSESLWCAPIDKHIFLKFKSKSSHSCRAFLWRWHSKPFACIAAVSFIRLKKLKNRKKRRLSSHSVSMIKHFFAIKSFLLENQVLGIVIREFKIYDATVIKTSLKIASSNFSTIMWLCNFV